MNIPEDLKYTKTHEWARVEGGEAVVGITDYAQEQLSDIVFVELPGIGDSFKQGDSFGVVESVKAASDFYTPLSGTVTAANDALLKDPALVNKDPYGAAWMVKLQPVDLKELGNLMDAAAYARFLETEGGHH
ncbi:MAG: glycine cleavage system protein GcvH [Chloroflexota bacterium]